MRWVQVSQKAFSPCCSLLQLSIFNLSCTLPIGLSATWRRLIGRSARCAIQALFSSLSSTSAAMQRGLLLAAGGNLLQVKALVQTSFKPPILTRTGGLSLITHQELLFTRAPAPSAPSACVCMVSILRAHTHTLSPPLCLSLAFSLVMHTAHVHTQRWKIKRRVV